jgi:hypothetical protein
MNEHMLFISSSLTSVKGQALEREHPALQNLSFTFILILSFLDPDPLNVSNKTTGLRMIYL